MATTIKHFTDKNGNTISIEAHLPLAARKSGDYWVVQFPQFRTFGYSNESEEKAIEDLHLSLDNFFDIHIERGTLEKALEKLGWVKQKNVFVQPKFFNTPNHKPLRELAVA